MYTCGPTVYRYAHVGNLRSNLLADLIRRALLYHGIDVLHVKNITDVGHLRDEGFDRGRGPDARRRRPRTQDAGRDRRCLRGGLPCRRGAGQHPAGPRLPAGDRAHPRDARARRGARGRRATPTPPPRATSTTTSAAFHGYGQLSGNTLDRPAGRPPGRRRAGQARPGRLRALEGGRRGPAAQVADAALGRGLPGLAPRMLGDGDALSRPRSSTSTRAASTTSSRTTRTRSPSRRRSSATSRRATGSTASSC